MTGKHQRLLEKLVDDIQRLAQGAIFHAEDMEDPEASQADIDHHNDAIGLHLKAMRSTITDFGNEI